MEEHNEICPKTWLLQSVLITIFCCIPFGVVGIINSCSVSSAFAAGNNELAEQKSKEAGKWVKIGFWCGIVGWILLIILYATGIYYIIHNGSR